MGASHHSCRRWKRKIRRSSAVMQRLRPNSSVLSLDRWVWNTFQAEAPRTRLFIFLARLSDLFKHPQPRQLKEYVAFKGDESHFKTSQTGSKSVKRSGVRIHQRHRERSRWCKSYGGLHCDCLQKPHFQQYCLKKTINHEVAAMFLQTLLVKNLGWSRVAWVALQFHQKVKCF